MIRRLLAIWPGHTQLRRAVTLYVVASVLQGVLFALLFPLLAALLAPTPDIVTAVRWLVVLLVVGVAYAVVTWRSRVVGYRMAHHIMRDLQHDLGAHLGRLPLGWFRAERIGPTARAVARSSVEVASMPSHLLPELVDAVLTPTTVVVVTLFVDWRMALAFLVTVPVAMLVLRWARPLMRSAMSQADHAAAEVAGRVVELAQAQPVLRSTGRAGEGWARLEQALEVARDRYRSGLRGLTAPVTAYTAVVAGGFSVVLVVGSALVLGGSVTVANVVALWVVAARSLEPLAVLIGLLGAVRSSEVALERVEQVLHNPPLPEPDATPRAVRGADIELAAVSFAYDTRPVLRELSMCIPAGATTALVGPSGSGKTTITRLIARFEDPDSGTVRIGGVDLRELPHAEVLRHVSIVFQDAYLFAGTIEENVRLARPDATDGQLRAAAQAARLDEVVDRLSAGWATRVGEGGTALSGGERQRVSIARALLKDAPIVLLDEATAALDPENEALIEDALSSLADTGRTVLVIAHRLPTIAAADHIVVLHDGRVVETGHHHGLLAAGGRYAELWAERARATGWRVTSMPGAVVPSGSTAGQAGPAR